MEEEPKESKDKRGEKCGCELLLVARGNKQDAEERKMRETLFLRERERERERGEKERGGIKIDDITFSNSILSLLTSDYVWFISSLGLTYFFLSLHFLSLSLTPIFPFRSIVHLFTPWRHVTSYRGNEQFGSTDESSTVLVSAWSGSQFGSEIHQIGKYRNCSIFCRSKVASSNCKPFQTILVISSSFQDRDWWHCLSQVDKLLLDESKRDQMIWMEEEERRGFERITFGCIFG